MTRRIRALVMFDPPRIDPVTAFFDNGRRRDDFARNSCDIFLDLNSVTIQPPPLEAARRQFD